MWTFDCSPSLLIRPSLSSSLSTKYVWWIINRTTLCYESILWFRLQRQNQTLHIKLINDNFVSLLFFCQLKKVIADGLLKAAADAGQITNICLSGGQFALYFVLSCYVMSYHVVVCLSALFLLLSLSISLEIHAHEFALPFAFSQISLIIKFFYLLPNLVPCSTCLHLDHLVFHHPYSFIFIPLSISHLIHPSLPPFPTPSLPTPLPLSHLILLPSPLLFLTLTWSFLSLTINPTAGLTAIPRIQATIKAVFPTANTLKGKFETSEVPCIGAALHGKYLAQLVSNKELLYECLVSSSQY